MAIVQVLIQKLALRVARLGLELLDLGIDMAIADQDVRPAVIVHVEKTAAPSEELRVRAQACDKGSVFETRSALVAIERWRIPGEISFDDIEIAVHVIVGSGYAHSGLWLAVWTQRATRFNGNVLKLSIFLVLIQGARGGIICDVDVRPAVIIEIGGEHTQTVRAIRAENARRFGNIRERAVSVVVIKNVFAALQARRAARHH